VLASLLPGLRDVRTPIAVGYLYIVLGWLSFSGQLTAVSKDDSPVPAALRQLLQGLGGRSAVLAVLSFIAYLVGALLTVPTEGRRVVTIGNRFGIKTGRDTAKSYDEYLNDLNDRLTETRRYLSPEDTAKWMPRPDPSVSQLRAYLLVANQQMYGEYDRLAAEGSFRINIAIHTLPLVVLLGLRVHWLYFLLVLASFLLLRQGLQRGMSSIQVLEEATLAGVVTHPRSKQLQEALLLADEESRSAKSLIVRGEVNLLSLSHTPQFVGVEQIQYGVRLINKSDASIYVETFDTFIRLIRPDGSSASRTALPRELHKRSEIYLKPGQEEWYPASMEAAADLDRNAERIHAVVDVALDFYDSAGRRWYRNYNGRLERTLTPVLLKA
jgi:hypothetical protein